MGSQVPETDRPQLCRPELGEAAGWLGLQAGEASHKEPGRVKLRGRTLLVGMEEDFPEDFCGEVGIGG